jgi:carboxypeptidase T
MNPRRHFSIALCMVGLLLSDSGATLAGDRRPQATIPVPTASSASDDAPTGSLADSIIVRLYVRDRDHLNAVAGQLDIWETHPADLYVVAAVSPAQYQWLQSLGYRLETDAVKTAKFKTLAALDPRFYYYDNNLPNSNNRYVVDFLQNTNSAYPNLTELLDIGDAWQAVHGGYHRDIWVLRITNEDPAFGPIANKPVFFLFADIHAREVATSELAIRYIRYLTSGYNGLGGYDVDPDVTWLVNYHTVYVLLMQNPDGHRVDEQDTSAYRRKNLNNSDGCTGSSTLGVDLNRNHSFMWGCCGGSSNICSDETYRGHARGSEPETQAFENYFATLVPDQNGPNDDTTFAPASPLTTTGILVSLHSYSDLVLWPWGFTTYGQSPNYAQLRTIGRKFAFFNGYDASGNIWYDVDGATDDWTYGRFGIASFTIEAGPGDYSACSDFFPAYGCIDGIDGMTRNFWAENRPVFVYAHKIARTPYLTAFGPDALALTVQSAQTGSGQVVTLTATLDDTRYADSEPAQNIAAAEYYVDTPPWITTTTPISHPMAAVDGSFSSTVEQVEATIDTTGLSIGRHIVFVRGQDAAGNWGAFSAAFMQVTAVPDSVIRGAVRTVASVPVDGATVRLTGGSTNLQQTTGADGLYAFAVFSNTYTITASAPAYYDVVTQVVALQGLTVTQDLTLCAIPTATLTGFVREDGSGLALASDVQAVSTGAAYQYHATTNPVTGYYSMMILSDTYTVTARSDAHLAVTQQATVPGGQTVSLDFSLPLTTCVLLVDDDGGQSYESYFKTALDQAGITFRTWDVAAQGGPGAADMTPYHAVLWFTGDDSAFNTLTTQDRTNLTAYLQNSGNLFLTGTEIGAGNQSQPFYTDWLYTRFIADNSAAKTLVGNGIFAGWSVTLNGGDGANNQAWPDAIEPRGQATSVFSYTNGQGGGVAVDAGTYRAINLGFGVEGINQANTRLGVVRDGLTWLGCTPPPHQWAISKTASASTVWAGELITYTLSLTHTSLITATNVVVLDALPLYTNFASASENGTLTANVVSWLVPQIAPMQTVNLTLAVTVANVLSGTALVNSAYSVHSDQTSAPTWGQPVTITALAGPCTPVEGADIISPLSARMGESVIFTGSVTPLDVTLPVTLTWTYGDGSEAEAGNPIAHVFPLTVTDQTYTVTLTAANFCGQAEANKTIKIETRRVYLPLLIKST